ncbi:unnamed protein product [Leptosia nina]|uniref:Odorant receptor n=1 Tax=Leptosia nina TaxID=320188 RepID=A0AAV1JLV3_9NEOP
MEIRKFRLEYCDLPTMVENVDFMLRLVYVRINKSNNRPINISAIILWTVSLTCYYYAYVFSMVWFVLVRCPETGDLLAACVVFSLVVCSQPSFLTMFHMIVYKKRVQSLIDNCLMLNELVKPGTVYSKNLHTHLRYIKKRATVVFITMVMNGILYVLMPIVLPGRHLTEDYQVIYGLEPMLETPNFEIASVMMALSVYICVFSMANITAFNLIILGYIEAQMVALSREIQSVWKNAEEFCKQRDHPHVPSHGLKHELQNMFVNETLKEIICFHIKCIEIIKEYNSVFRVTKAIEFTVIILAIISELLGGIENTYLEIPFTFVLISMECVAGQKLTDASSNFERAVYSCKWENFNVKNRRIILSMLPIAQRMLSISAGGMAVLNYSCMLSVAKFSYSTYNTLRLMVK